MKLTFLSATVAILFLTACKTPYRATDTSRVNTDSTSATRDSSVVMQNTPSSTTDSAMNRIDNTIKDSARNAQPDTSTQSKPDSSRMPSTIDSSRVQPVNSDTTRANPMEEVSSMTADSAAARAGEKKNTTNTVTPAAISTSFSKQYPSAKNMTWSPYDSLAAVPIDMRLTGWKKLDADDYMVKFDQDGDTYYAWYDSEGKWIGSASPMEDVTKLPAAVKTAVNNAIKTRYAGYTISQVNREFQTGKKSYEVELTKEDNKVRMMVTSAGKIGQIYRYKTSK